MEYKINRDFIAKNLCINKVKKETSCNGKCQLMKRLAQEEKQSNSTNTRHSKIKIQEQVFSDEINQPKLPFVNYTTLSYNEQPPLLKYEAPSSPVFHPPAIS